MAKQYQIIQERYVNQSDMMPTQDDYPILFASIEEARAHINSLIYGLRGMFEHDGDRYFIAELTDYRDGVTYTGQQFPL